MLLAGAAWLRGPARDSAPRRSGERRIALPIVFAAAVVILLALGSFTEIGAPALGLAVASLGVVLIRLAITFRQNSRMIALTRHDAVTDSLTRARRSPKPPKRRLPNTAAASR